MADGLSDYEQGTVDACNAILAFLHRTGQHQVAADVLAAWQAGPDVIERQAEEPPNIEATLLGPPKLDRATARDQGFTGDSCTNCQSMRMKVAGHCMVCDECGTTTGCS